MSSSRKKSCQKCRTAKARCDLLLPSCTRCLERRISCQYDGSHAPLRSGACRAKIAKLITTAITPPLPVALTVDRDQQHLLPPSDYLNTEFFSFGESANDPWLTVDLDGEVGSSLASFTPTCEPDLLSTNGVLSRRNATRRRMFCNKYN